jgi:hypothetical protein
VDTLDWSLIGAYTTHQIGPFPADGVYLVATLDVHNGKTGQVTLNEGVVNLVIGKRSYSNESGTAEEPHGASPLELGFGTTHAYIALPDRIDAT